LIAHTISPALRYYNSPEKDFIKNWFSAIW